MEHHNDHHSTEKKPVAFTVPLILGAIAVFVIVLFVSLGNPCHQECACAEDCSTECKQACEKGDHSLHPADTKHNEGHAECGDCKDGKVCEHHKEGVSHEASKEDVSSVETHEVAAEPSHEEHH